MAATETRVEVREPEEGLEHLTCKVEHSFFSLLLS